MKEYVFPDMKSTKKETATGPDVKSSPGEVKPVSDYERIAAILRGEE